MTPSVRPNRRKKPAASRRPSTGGAERLQKVLAAAGVGSRRECEQLIVDGRVEIDRSVITELGTRVDRSSQEIRVDGEPLAKPRLAYYALNKPPGVVSTARDPAGRPRVTDLLPPDAGRLFCVGRLDMSSEGLILLTNDGELADLLTHPRYGVEKTYDVEVAGRPEPSVLAVLRRGVHLAEGMARVSRVRIKGRRRQSTTLEIVLDEGRNREIRRLLARVGHKVLRLTRVAVGPIRLGDLPSGAYRPLSRDELRALRNGAAKKPKSATAGRRSGRRKQGRPR